MTATAIKLYEATDAIEIVRTWIEEHDEELRANEGVLPAELAELLDRVDTDFAVKAERVALFIREMLSTAKAIKEEEDRLHARRKAMENASDRLKRYLEMNMLQAERMRIDGKLVTLRIQLNNPSVRHELTQEQLATVVDEYVNVVPRTYRLNAIAVIAHWKATGESPIDGVIVERGASLRIA